MAAPLSAAARENLWYLAAGLGLLVLIVMLSFWGAAASTETARPSKRFERRLQGLMSEAAQWSAASAQDTNALLALVHATYGVAYLNVARSLASDADIERHCNLRLDEFAGQLTNTQQSAMRNVTGQCKSLAAPGLASLHTGWLAPTE